jgi:S1-C subfamily serine protease
MLMLLRSALVVTLTTAVAACADADPEELSPEEKVALLHEATLLLVPPRCAGVILADGRRALTAAHCLPRAEAPLVVQLQDGERIEVALGAVDRARDIAVLHLTKPALFSGLARARELPEVGTEILFAGRPDRSTELQEANIVAIDRCPWLPESDVLVTTIRGEPGDSGAPIVDRQLRLLGLVQSGFACENVTPTTDIDALLVEPAPD